jgi:DNA-nicking Smr family endonuclease
MTAREPAGPAHQALAEALDEAAVLRDLLALVFWAAEAVPGPKGAGLARGTMMAQDRLDLLIARLEEARSQLRPAPKRRG